MRGVWNVSVFTLHTFEINSVSEQWIGIVSDGLAGFRWLRCSRTICKRTVCWALWCRAQSRVRCGLVAANQAAIFKEDNLAGVKIWFPSTERITKFTEHFYCFKYNQRSQYERKWTGNICLTVYLCLWEAVWGGDYVKQLNISFLILSPPLSFASDSFKDKTTMIPWSVLRGLWCEWTLNWSFDSHSQQWGEGEVRILVAVIKHNLVSIHSPTPCVGFMVLLWCALVSPLPTQIMHVDPVRTC